MEMNPETDMVIATPNGSAKVNLDKLQKFENLKFI